MSNILSQELKIFNLISYLCFFNFYQEKIRTVSEHRRYFLYNNSLRRKGWSVHSVKVHHSMTENSESYLWQRLKDKIYSSTPNL